MTSDFPKIIKNTGHSSDKNLDICYEQGKFLGKGGFAKCYEFRQISNRKLYAGKVVPKTLLVDDFIMVSIQTSVPWKAVRLH